MYKKYLLIIFLIIFIPNNIYGNQRIKVIVDDKEVEFDQEPIIKDNRTYVPIRAVLESMGYHVEWQQYGLNDIYSRLQVEGYRRSFYINLDTNYIKSLNGSSYDSPDYRYADAYLDDTPPIIINGRTLIPLRAVSENMGYDVDWNGETKTVNILTGIPEEIKKENRELYEANGKKEKEETKTEIVKDKVNIEEVENSYIHDGKYYTLEEIQKGVAEATNEVRKQNGVPALEEDPDLNRVAQLKAEELVELDYQSHVSPVYGSIKEFMIGNGYTNVNSSGELLLKSGGFTELDGVVGAWEESKPHFELMISTRYKRVGFGYSLDEKGRYRYVLMLAG